MANIKYQIFRNRRKFNILNYLRRSSDKSYQAFEQFLASKSVISPGEDYFNKALTLFNSTLEREQSFQQSKESSNVSVEKEEVVKDVTEEKVEEVKQEEPVKTVKRRRRRKREEDEN